MPLRSVTPILRYCDAVLMLTTTTQVSGWLHQSIGREGLRRYVSRNTIVLAYAITRASTILQVFRCCAAAATMDAAFQLISRHHRRLDDIEITGISLLFLLGPRYLPLHDVLSAAMTSRARLDIPHASDDLNFFIYLSIRIFIISDRFSFLYDFLNAAMSPSQYHDAP